MRRLTLFRWLAALMLAIALAPAAVSAQEDGTLTISGLFSMDYLNGENDLNWFVPDLVAVYANGHDHTWTLTLHGTTRSHYTNGSYYATDIHATSFDLEFFGPDAATLNGLVNEHLAGGDVGVYLQNTYYDYGGGFAIMHVWVSGGDPGMYFYTGHDIGVNTLFPTDADGYPVVGPDPFSIEPDYTEMGYSDLLSGTGGAIGSLAGPVTFKVGAPPSSGVLGTAVNYPADANLTGIIAADFNNDGQLDLVVANPTANSVTVMLGNGNGTFHSPFEVPQHSPSPWLASVGVADFNADQKMDLVVVSDIEIFSGTGGWIEVLFGDGAGAFPTSQLTEGSPASPSLLAIDDLNADGTPDVVVAGSGYVEVWLGDSSGNFWLPYFTTGLGGQGSVGDLTGDGILDLVIAGQTVDVLPGLGNGTFDEPITQAANGNLHTGVAVADFNGDGKFDVVTSDGDAGTVSLLLGNGDGTLSYIGAFAAGTSPSGVVVGDFNRDGRPDVAAANGGSNNVSVLLNQMAPCTTFVAPDLDHDCDVDAADMTAFVACASGPNVPVTPSCQSRDFDGDNDADMNDFAILQRCYGNAVPGCVN